MSRWAWQDAEGVPWVVSVLSSEEDRPRASVWPCGGTWLGLRANRSSSDDLSVMIYAEGHGESNYASHSG